MLKRKIYTDLKKWKEKREKECLIVKGARQVGKTFLINEFGKNGKTISLNNFIKNYKPSVAYKVIYGNKSIDGVKKTLPYYIIGLMKDK